MSLQYSPTSILTLCRWVRDPSAVVCSGHWYIYHLQVLPWKIQPEIFFLLTFERSGQQSAVVTIFAAECSITAKLEQSRAVTKGAVAGDQLEIFTGGSMLTWTILTCAASTISSSLFSNRTIFYIFTQQLLSVLGSVQPTVHPAILNTW